MNKLFSKGKEKILECFYRNRKEMYFSEILRETKLTPNTTLKHLKNLQEANLISSTKKIGNTFYRINSNQTVYSIFTYFDNLRLNSLNRDVKIPLNEFIKRMPKETAFIILFGSSSRKQEKKGSDIDLLIVLHDFKNKELQEQYEKYIKNQMQKTIEKINAASIHPFVVFYTTTKVFKHETDYLVTEAKNTGFCIYNNQGYCNWLLNNESEPMD